MYRKHGKILTHLLSYNKKITCMSDNKVFDDIHAVDVASLS